MLGQVRLIVPSRPVKLRLCSLFSVRLDLEGCLEVRLSKLVMLVGVINYFCNMVRDVVISKIVLSLQAQVQRLVLCHVTETLPGVFMRR